MVHWLTTDRDGGGLQVRSACQAGFKGCWGGPREGFPSPEVWNRVRAGFGDAVVEKFESQGTVVSPGTAVGSGLSAKAARALGLREGTPVAASTVDAHAGVPGVGVGEAGTLVMVMGTSGCYMLNHRMLPRKVRQIFLRRPHQRSPYSRCRLLPRLKLNHKWWRECPQILNIVALLIRVEWFRSLWD